MNISGILSSLEGVADYTEVRYDFGPFVPEGLDSYRGYYDQLALGYRDGSNGYSCTVGQLRAELEDAVGKTFEGYKGGEYTMSRSTKVWVANYGRSHGTYISHISIHPNTVILHTDNESAY